MQLSVNNKPPNPEGQGEKKDNANATAPPAPPTYEEATAGEGVKMGAYPPPPSVPLHPSWAYVDPSEYPRWEGGAEFLPRLVEGRGARDGGELVSSVVEMLIGLWLSAIENVGKHVKYFCIYYRKIY